MACAREVHRWKESPKNFDELPCRCWAGWWDHTAEGKADNDIRVGWPGVAELELVGSLLENALAFPN